MTEVHGSKVIGGGGGGVKLICVYFTKSSCVIFPWKSFVFIVGTMLIQCSCDVSYACMYVYNKCILLQLNYIRFTFLVVTARYSKLTL